jgi:hypothetical protein
MAKFMRYHRHRRHPQRLPHDGLFEHLDLHALPRRRRARVRVHPERRSLLSGAHGGDRKSAREAHQQQSNCPGNHRCTIDHDAVKSEGSVRSVSARPT